MQCLSWNVSIIGWGTLILYLFMLHLTESRYEALTGLTGFGVITLVVLIVLQITFGDWWRIRLLRRGAATLAENRSVKKVEEKSGKSQSVEKYSLYRFDYLAEDGKVHQLERRFRFQRKRLEDEALDPILSDKGDVVFFHEFVFHPLFTAGPMHIVERLAHIVQYP